MNIIKLYEDMGIPYRTEGHKHCSQGWVQVTCPHCSGNPGWHLGYCLKEGPFLHRFVCRRCGGHGTIKTLSALLQIPDLDRVKSLIRSYGWSGGYSKIRQDIPTPKLFSSTPLPPGLLPIEEVPGAEKYLIGRGFNRAEIALAWHVQASGGSSLVKMPDRALNYAYRLIIPIELGDAIVSYQGRDWTGRREPKYMACPEALETIHHKHTLYGLDQARGLDTVVVMEGVTDVWRYGPGGVCCFGVKFMYRQVLELAIRFHRVVILFDPDMAGRLATRKLGRELREEGIEVVPILLDRGETDPGAMDRDKLLELVRKNTY